MRVIELIKIALTALRINLMRSLLTMLGVIIGVAAVIVMVALGAGAQREIDRQLDSLGGNIFIVMNNYRRQGTVAKARGTIQKLSVKEQQFIETDVPGVDRAGASLRSQGQIIFGNINWRTEIDGIDNGAFIARNLNILEGREFTDREQRSAAKVVILGATVREELFGAGEALGQIVRINDFNAKVVGTLKVKGQSMWGSDLDDRALVPLETVRKRITGVSKHSPKSVSSIAVKILDGYDMVLAEEDISSALRISMKIPPGESDTFRVRNMSEIYAANAESEKIFNSLLAAVAAVSLLVGGIGIMNIMLVSVSERTNEIGLRMAVGAKPSDILTQFLVEATTLCCIGGFLGIVSAVCATFLIESYANTAAVIEYHVIGISFLFSAVIGIFFGYYPALKASKLQPIEALRHE